MNNGVRKGTRALPTAPVPAVPKNLPTPPSNMPQSEQTPHRPPRPTRGPGYPPMGGSMIMRPVAAQQPPSPRDSMRSSPPTSPAAPTRPAPPPPRRNQQALNLAGMDGGGSGGSPRGGSSPALHNLAAEDLTTPTSSPRRTAPGTPSPSGGPMHRIRSGAGSPALVRQSSSPPGALSRSPSPPVPGGGSGSGSGGSEGSSGAGGSDADDPLGLLSSGNTPIKTDFAKDRKLDDDPRRANIILEIQATEQAYIASVEQMIKHYKASLRTLAMTSSEIDEEDIKNMFSNVHLILPLNQELLKNINQRIDSWSPTQKLGDVFLRMAPFLKMYNDYSNNYKYALQLYNKYCAESPKFFETLSICKSTCKPPTNLENLLIMPIQRIPRYNLLLEDLLKHTPEDHPDHNDLKSALAVMKEVAQHINASVKKTENLRKLAEASSKGTGFRGLMKAHRQLVRDGLMQTVDNKGHKEKLHFFLFNDILVYANKSEVKKQKDMTRLNTQWPINLVWLTHPPSNTGQVAGACFELVGPNRSLTVVNLPPDEVELWTSEIKKSLSSFEGDKREGEFIVGMGKYSGEWLKGQIHGQGTFWVFGSQYEGQWDKGLKSGGGTMIFPTGDVYTGQWANDLQNGQGVLQYVSGAKYTGGWKDGKKHGPGEFIYENGDRYAGGWKEDLCSGEGKMELQSGVVYDGMWEAGKFHGKGTLTLPSGKVYMGEWANGKRDGQGVLDCGNGERYEGTWKQGKRHGVGTYYTPDAWGSRYSGQWAMGKKEGNGTMTYLDNSVYEGAWKADVPHGKGCMTKANGDKYTGHFKFGKPHGNVVVTFASTGLEYNGKFSGGVREGKCTLARIVSEEERQAVLAAEEGGGSSVEGRAEALLVDKFTGNSNPKDGVIGFGYEGANMSIMLVPERPVLDFSL